MVERVQEIGRLYHTDWVLCPNRCTSHPNRLQNNRKQPTAVIAYNRDALGGSDEDCIQISFFSERFIPEILACPKKRIRIGAECSFKVFHLCHVLCKIRRRGRPKLAGTVKHNSFIFSSHGNIAYFPFQNPGPCGTFPSHGVLFTKSFVYSISFSAIFFPSSKPARVSSGNAIPPQSLMPFVAAPSWFTESVEVRIEM